MINKPASTDAYIASFPADLRPMLDQLRKTIKAAAPAAAEIISYGMPAYKQNGMVAWFACHTKHVSLYIRPATKQAFLGELFAWKGTMSTIHFPFGKLLPLDLITRIVQYQVAQNLIKMTARKSDAG